MIVIFLTSLVVYAIYTIFDHGTNVHLMQDNRVTMQAQARFALEHLRRDIKNAGYQISPNTENDTNVCPAPVSHHKAFRLAKGTADFDTWPLKVANPNLDTTRIVLFGDLRVGKSWFTEFVVGNNVKLKNPPATQEEWDEIFTTDSYLRIVNHEQYEMLYAIQSTNFAAKMITLVSTPPIVSDGNPCGIDGLGENEQVNVVDYVRYRVVIDPTDPSSRRTMLIRELLKQNGVSTRDRGVIAIARNVIELQLYDFVFDSNTDRTLPSLDRTLFRLEQVLDGSDNGKLGLASGPGGAPKPEDLRFVTVKITLRGDDEDPKLTHKPRVGVHEPITTFDILPNVRGAAHTLTMASKMELRSFTVRNLKPGL